MKEIKAYVRPILLDGTISRLEEAGVRDITVIRVDALGVLADSEMDRRHMFRKYNEKYSSVAKLEIVCQDGDAKRFVGIIRESAHTGDRGDGRVFVSNVEYAVSIRTGNENEEAL